jgi:hypothetical protein
LTRSILTGAPLAKPLAPHIQPQYYAGIVAASLIGSGSGSISIVELDINAPGGNIGGYATFYKGKLVRALLINANAWLTTSNGTRPSVEIKLDIVVATSSKPSSKSLLNNLHLPPTKAQLRRLEIRHADDTSGVSFGGKTYETSSGRPNGRDKYEIIDLHEAITILDTEAVLVTFEY